MVSIDVTSAGSSPKRSYVRPQRSSRATHRQGAKSHGMPVARTSVGGDRADLLDERRVAGRAQADVVREDRRADHVVVAVHRVHAVDQRDLQPGRLRPQLEAVDMSAQASGVFGVGHRAAAGQQRAERVRRDVGRAVERVALGLGHLADLLLQRHPRTAGPRPVAFTGQIRVQVRQSVRVDDDLRQARRAPWRR